MRLLIMLLVITLSSLCFAEPVAIVVRAGGEVSKTDSDSAVSSLKRRDTLSEGDRIITGQDAYATLKFTDQSVVDLGANSVLAITQFRDNAETGEKKILLELLSGRLRNITGALAKDADAFDLRTAHASIGVRGTEFEVILTSATETQVQWHSGVVLVRSLEFMDQELELTRENPTASVTFGAPAKYIDQLSSEPLGPFNADFLTDISLIPVIPIVAPIVVVPTVPAVVPLSDDGAVPAVDGQENLEPIEAFVAMVKAKEWKDARVLANELQDRFEGLPRFDLYHGILLMAETRFDEAIFSFERVLIFSPDQHRARLELGRAYYLTGNYARARDSLGQVLLSDPPGQVKGNVQTLLNRIDEAERRAQTQTQFGGTVLAGWDSNANSGSNLSGDLDPNLLALTSLANASLPIESSYLQWSVTTGLTKPTSQFATGRFSVDFTHKNYVEPTLNDSSALTVSTLPIGQTNRWRSQFPMTAQYSWLEGQSWQGMFDFNAMQQYRVWGPLWVGVKIGSQVNVAIDSANVSSAKDLAGAVFDVQERGRVHSLSTVYLQTLQAGQDDEHEEWRGLANRYQLQWSLPLNVQAVFSAEHQWRQYKSEDLFFTINDVSTELKLRQDQIINTEFQALWSPLPWLQSQTRLSWEWVDSNINAYGRERITASQAINIRF